MLVFTQLCNADFAIRDGDTVVFLGDSITAARHYGKVIENYTLLRFPERQVRFINAGMGGETAQGSLTRLKEAVFDQGATILTVAYGVNDIGWGTKADQAHKQEYLDAIKEIVERCKEKGVRVFICSAAITAEDPDRAKNGFLQTMCDEGLALAKANGASAIDVQRYMRQVQRRVLAANGKEPDSSKHTHMHVADGVHLNDLGQMAMACAILKGLDAPAEVSSSTLDAALPAVGSQDGCTVTKLEHGEGSLSFTRLDERLPLNLHPLWMLHGFYIPIGDELNQYLLTVKNLSSGRYNITAGGRPVGTWSARELAKGVNLASATTDPWQPGGLWDAQAHVLKVFTDMRDEMAQARRNMATDLTSHPDLAVLQKRAQSIEEELVDLQRQTARPVPVEFVIRKIPAN